MYEQTTPSLEKLKEFIGRETILQDVHAWLQDGGFHSVFFSGDYGIGKTRLLQRILDLARREWKYDGVPTRLIDLYHFRHHSPEGLARAIAACFEKTDDAGYFEFYLSARRRLEAARAAGDSSEIRKQLENLLNSCTAGLKKMSAERGLLLLFDTAEQFVYPSQKKVRFAPAWDWLKSWVGELQRGVVLFAGRPTAEALFQESSFSHLLHIPLSFFSPEESRAYLLAIAERWSQIKNDKFDFAEDDIQRLHVLSQGRPILLTIYLELKQGDPLAFQDLSALQPETFEKNIINYLMTQPELGETLKAAGRAPKGINTELLSKIRGISVRDAKQALDDLKELSFAKTFHDDDRVFLHDEMYTLLEKYVYADVADTIEGQTAAQAIYDYYKQEIKQKDKALKNIYARLTQEADFRQPIDLSNDPLTTIRTLEASRQTMKTEFVYYRLRHQVGKKGERKAFEDDPILAGLKNYYRFAHEAATSNNDEILIPLQIELSNFWLRLKDENYWKSFIEGLLLVHEVWIKVATGQPYLDDVSTYEKNLIAISNLSADQKIILHVLFETWHGTGILFSRGAKKEEFERSDQIFTQTIDSIKDFPVSQQLKWFKDVVISLAYRQRAYSYRIRGSFQDAIEDFQAGLHFSRAIDFYHEEATLRNDLGFAQMQNGQFQSAFENMWDGLQLRYEAAIGPRIALSHSSLAQHFISIGAFEEARKHAHYAIRAAGAVDFRRGLGFGKLAFAEATRRFAFSAQGPSNQAEYLQEAQHAIETAIHLLEQLGEKARIIDSKMEHACLYRDLMRIETESSQKKTWFEISDKQFREVENASEEAGIDYRLVDAMCNRVWLGYFAGDLEYANQAANEFETLKILQPYWFVDGKFINETQAQKNPILWSHIGKYFMGRGVMALNKWKKDKKGETMIDSAQYIMMGMTYSTKFASDHRGLREGRRTIYQVLADLNPNELKQFCHYILQAEEEEKIQQRPSVLQLLMKDHALWFAD